jgi:hypothetical protein
MEKEMKKANTYRFLENTVDGSYPALCFPFGRGRYEDEAYAHRLCQAPVGVCTLLRLRF